MTLLTRVCLGKTPYPQTCLGTYLSLNMFGQVPPAPVNQTLSKNDVIWQLLTIDSNDSCKVWLMALYSILKIAITYLLGHVMSGQ